MNKPKRLVSCVLATLTFVCAALSQSPAPILPSQIDDFATLLITTTSPQDRSNLLASKKDLLTPDLRRSLIRQGNVHLMAGQYGSAFDIYRLAKNIAEQIGDQEGVAAASLDIGTVYYFQANYPAALEQYRKARQLFSQVNNKYESAKALSGLALIYKEQRHDAQALEALQQTLAEFTELSDKEEMANALSSIGGIYYGQGKYAAAAEAFRKSAELNTNAENVLRIADSLYMQGDYAQASRYYKQSLTTLADQNNAAGMIAALNGAANSAYYQGNYDDALEYYQQNLSLERTQRDQVGVVNSLRGIANVQRARGDYSAALETYLQSLQLAEGLKTNTGSLLASIGLTRALQSNNSAALDYYGKALKQFETDGNKIDTARVLSLIGNADYALGNFALAIDSYRKGLALREAMDDKSGQADLLIGLGTVFLRQRDFPQSLSSYEAALKLVEPTGNKAAIATVLTRLADVYLLQSNYGETLNLANRAAGLAREAESADVLWYSQLLIGRAQRGLEKLTQAQDAFASAVSLIEALRSAPTLSEADSSRNSLLPYQAAVDLFIEEGKAAEALDHAERAKVQNLYEVFRRNNAKSVKGLTPKEQSDERNLIGEAVSLQLQLERDAQLRTATEVRQSKLRERLRQTRTSYADFRNQLFRAHQHLKIERGELAPVKLEHLGALVADRQTALLEFVTTDRDTYLFVVTLDPNDKTILKRKTTSVGSALSLKAYPLNLRYEELRSLVKQLDEMLLERNDAVGQNLRQLYDVLLKPAAEQLAGRTKLVIVPDGLLWHVPFAALQPSADRYIIDQMEVSYAPSISALREFRKQRRVPATPTLLAMGNPALASQLTERIKLTYEDLQLSSSSEQANEIAEVAALYPMRQRQVFVDAQASEEALKRELVRAGLVHIAAPSLLDDASPMSSFVGLSSGASPNDGFLQTREVLNLQTPARLVILSGVSNVGDYFTAPLSLSWAWFVAGAPTVALNRWEVRSPATTKLMKELHTRLRPGRVTKAAALQQSALTLRNSSEYRHPFYWSGWVLIGDAR
jgi:CHAT domain-containing protein